MSTLIRANRLLTSSSADMIPHGAMLIQGERIRAVGTWDELSRVEGAPSEVVALGDVTLMPACSTVTCNCRSTRAPVRPSPKSH